MEQSKSEDSSKDRKSSARSKCIEGQASHNSSINGFLTMHNTVGNPCSLPVPDTLDLLLPRLSDTLSEGNEQLPSSVKKSKTHDCVKRMGLSQSESSECEDETNWRHRHKLVTSVSFSGFDAPLQLLCENRITSGGSHEIIDYRNLTPQVPFVPCIAKSIPKKRISLRKPQKAIKDLFVHRRHKHEKTVSPGTPCHVARNNVPTLKKTKKSLRHKERASARSRYNEHSETPSDSSGEYCSNVCEDVASLKSFGSQAGCGEIYADEEFIVSPDGVLNPVHNKEASEAQKRSATAAGFQGGNECLASPGPTEVLDMFGMWEMLNRTLLFGQHPRENTDTTTPSTKSPSTTKSENITANTPITIESQIRELNTDVVSPKSDNQENTSDEGYCDYVSPGFEDHSRNSLTPVHSNKFTRDTYSGDALYELFCDPDETMMNPIFDNEMDLTDSIVGQTSDLPLSMYSFHVGAEENLAPPLARDYIGQELLQSKWMGKDCLLKLCDTEISLAMGIVNWLKHKTDKSNPVELKSSHTSHDETGLFLKYKTHSSGVRKPPRGAPSTTVNGKGELLNFKERVSSQQRVPIMDLPLQNDVNMVMSTLVSPESLPKTPTSGVCFRICNIDSPMTTSEDLQSPVLNSPGFGTRSLFVLAINKESLCESCKRSLKNGAKNLFLCRTCLSLIEHIKTSDLWDQASLSHSKTLTPQLITRDLLSPASTCGIESDISIASIVEQCANQLSSMQINITQKHLSCDKRGALESEQGVKRNMENSSKYLKSKHKKRSVATNKKKLHSRHGMSRSSLSEDVCKPSVLESEGLGFVTSNGTDDLVLETYKSQCCIESSDTVTSQTTRPTSLPLMASTSSDFSCIENHHLKRMEDRSLAKTKHRLPRHKKSAVNSDGQCGDVSSRERKVQRKSRMK